MKKERKNKIMEENSSISFWKVAVTILLAAILIGVVFLIARQGKSVANEKLEGISGMLSEYQDESYAMYGGMEVSGAEVKNVIENAMAKDDVVCIRVYTKADVAGKDYVYKASVDPTEALHTFDALSSTESANVLSSSKSDVNYINPSAVFEGSVMRNTNGALIGLVFEQK